MEGHMDALQAFVTVGLEFVGWIIFFGLFVLGGWAVGYRQGYVVGREDAAAIARRERERA